MQNMSSRRILPFINNALRPSSASLQVSQRTVFSHELRRKPKPVIIPNPTLVRPESELKSIIQLDKSFPVLLDRLELIRSSPVGWIDRMVPPPQLPYDVKRKYSNRFDIQVEKKGYGRRRGWYTTLYRAQGDISELKKCLEWRLGQKCMIYNSHSIEVRGFHRVTISTLLQGLGF